MRGALVTSLLAVALLIRESSATVYTCNEIGNTLLPRNLSVTAAHACVVLQDLLPPETPWLTAVLLRDDASGREYSLASVATVPGEPPCVEGAGPWRLVTVAPASIVDCTYEATLVFSTVPLNLIVVVPHAYEYIRGPGSDLTFVSPRGGISLNWHTEGPVSGQERIEFFSGAGAGPAEDVYPIGSLQTKDLAEGRDTDIFDPVFTVRIPANISIEIGYNTFADKALNVFGYPGWSVVVASSGRATTFQEQNTMKVVQAGYGRRASVRVTGSVSFDPSTDHKLKLQAFCEDGIACGERIITQSTEIDWLLNAEKFRVNYVTGLNASQIGKNADNLFISVESSREKCDEDFVQLGEQCFRVSASSSTFADAESACEASGARLASIHNEDTNTLLHSLSAAAPLGAFIGLRKAGKGAEFGWTDGTPLDYVNGQLDSSGGGDCGILAAATGAWASIDCEFALRFICEKKAN